MDKASITSDTHIGQVMTMTWHSKVNPLLYASPSTTLLDGTLLDPPTHGIFGFEQTRTKSKEEVKGAQEPKLSKGEAWKQRKKKQ
jgi:hypothetical protein